MSKDLAAKYYLVKDIKIFLEKKKKTATILLRKIQKFTKR